MAFIGTQQEALGLPRDSVGMRRPDTRSFAGYPVWTDDYSNLFSLLKPKDSS